MKAKFLTLILFACSTITQAQLPKKNSYIVGVLHQKNINVYGVGVALFSGFDEEDRNVQTNGIRLEAFGMGILVPLIPKSPVSETEEEFAKSMSVVPSERINGFNISPFGTVCDCVTNGISTGLIGQIGRTVNGISASVMMNFAERHNGIQMAMFNESYAMGGIQLGLSNSGVRARGLQIGLVNHSKDLRGLQVGLWNVNQKRKMPILNWSFSK